MSEFKVGDVIKVRFGVGARQAVKDAKVLALKTESAKEILVEATDGSIIATVVPTQIDQHGVKVKVDSMCPVHSTAYTREKAIKTLGYKHLR